MCLKLSADTFVQSNFHYRPPLHNGHFFWSSGQSLHWLLFFQKPLYNGNGHLRASPTAKIGTLSNYYDDDDDKVKTQLALWPKQQLCTCITLFGTSLWRPLHDFNVKPTNATFYRGRGHTTKSFLFSIWTCIKPLRINSRKSSLHLTNWTVPFRRDKVWKDANSFLQWCFHCRRRRSSCLKPLPTSRQLPVFSATSEKLRNFDSQGALMIKRGIRILIVLYMYCCSKHKLSTILLANVVSFARFVSLTFWFETLLKFFIWFWLSLWDTVSMNLAQ